MTNYSANYLAKCQELLRFIPDLQCHKCKDLPGPNENEKNRYSCVNSSHTLCEKDKLKCPCGSLVGKNPSPIIAKLLQNLPWMCQNYKRGCREIRKTIGRLEFHQRECIFRKVYCPSLDCYKESMNIELLFKDVNKHLGDFHADYREVPMLNGETNRWMVKLTDQKGNFEQNIEDHQFSWSPGKMTNTSGDIFFFESRMSNDSFDCWVNFFGSSDDAKNFTVQFYIGNKSEKIQESLDYKGLVHTLDKEQFDIMDEQRCFSIKLKAVKRFLNKKKMFCILIVIKNIKDINDQNEDEDYGESDESEKKPTVKKRRRSMRSKTEVPL